MSEVIFTRNGAVARAMTLTDLTWPVARVPKSMVSDEPPPAKESEADWITLNSTRSSCESIWSSLPFGL